MSKNLTACPCCSGKNYADCCQPFHLHQSLPLTPEALMRSRYAAYVLVNVPYIVETTVPSQQKFLDQIAMKEWGESTQWAGLEIMAHQPALTKIHGLVEFKAYFETDEGKQAHHERSLFVKIDGKWYFADPTVPLPSNKQHCICGSGKKFKYCCGTYFEK